MLANDDFELTRKSSTRQRYERRLLFENDKIRRVKRQNNLIIEEISMKDKINFQTVN